MACAQCSRRGLMSQLASYAALAALFDDTLRCQNRPRQLRRSQAVGWRGEFPSQRASIFEIASVGERKPKRAHEATAVIGLSPATAYWGRHARSASRRTFVEGDKTSAAVSATKQRIHPRE